MSISGRVVILKFVLTGLMIYFLSFFKAPLGLVSKLESLFKRFLWGANKEENKINWVNWKKVCLLVEDRDYRSKIWGSSWWKELYRLSIDFKEVTNEYSVKDNYKGLIMNLTNYYNSLWSRAWNKEVPIKVMCFVWRVFQNKIPTKDNLAKRGVLDIGLIWCVRECGR